MIKHKPRVKTDVKIDGIIYRSDKDGIVLLPKAYQYFNPIEQPKKKKKEVSVCSGFKS